MIAKPILPQLSNGYPHFHAQRPIPLAIRPIVMPAHAGIQRLGLCGVRS